MPKKSFSLSHHSLRMTTSKQGEYIDEESLASCASLREDFVGELCEDSEQRKKLRCAVRLVRRRGGRQGSGAGGLGGRAGRGGRRVVVNNSGCTTRRCARVLVPCRGAPSHKTLRCWSTIGEQYVASFGASKFEGRREQQSVGQTTGGKLLQRKGSMRNIRSRAPLKSGPLP